jgi:hypothetical protein
MDYMRGRYLRTTYTRLESMYVRYYELPAAFRATCRTLAQLSILVLLNGIMGWMVGVHHAPCSVDGSCPRMWCALLWIVAVVGTGHACSTAVRAEVRLLDDCCLNPFSHVVTCIDNFVVRLQFGVDHFGYRWAPVTCTPVAVWRLESLHDPGTFCNGCRILSSGSA